MDVSVSAINVEMALSVGLHYAENVCKRVPQ